MEFVGLIARVGGVDSLIRGTANYDVVSESLVGPRRGGLQVKRLRSVPLGTVGVVRSMDGGPACRRSLLRQERADRPFPVALILRQVGDRQYAGPTFDLRTRGLARFGGIRRSLLRNTQNGPVDDGVELGLFAGESLVEDGLVHMTVPLAFRLHTQARAAESLGERYNN